jgi:hypothetical protein
MADLRRSDYRKITKRYDRNATALAGLRILVGMVFALFGKYKVFRTDFTPYLADSTSGSEASSPRALIRGWSPFWRTS